MIKKYTLENGVRLICQPMESFRSVSMGVWVGAGSICERASEAGATHFIEHMLFKGTDTRSAQQIAAEMDALGGNLNAFTAKECTCYYAKVLDEHMRKSADILADLVLHPKLDPEDIEREKGVVCEEILMTEDTPEDLVHEVMAAQMYGDTPLGKPILGSEASVRALTDTALRDYMGRHYLSGSTVVAVAGHFEEEALLDTVRECFGAMPAKTEREKPERSVLCKGRGIQVVNKDIEQVHICLSVPGYAADTPEQYALLVLNNALGGSMSSRLFQSIREQRGLAYSVYSYPSPYADSGYFTLYAGTGEKQAGQVVGLMLEELAKLGRAGLTREEFERAKDQLKSSFILGQESTSSRANAIGKAELLRDSVRTEEEALARIEAVRMEDVEAILPALCSLDDLRGAFVGRVSAQEKDVEKRIMEA